MSDLLSSVCDCCGQKGVGGDGNGRFEDVDMLPSDFTYPGIPICGGCGGLGVQYNCSDFKSRVARIMELRFLFHPIDGLPQSPTIMPYIYLKDLLKEVEELTEKYGFGVENSFARNFASSTSKYRIVLPMMKIEIDEEIKNIGKTTPTLPEDAVESARKALIKLYSGEVDSGIDLYREVLEKFPEDSRLCHDFGTIQIMFKRNMQTALQYFQASTVLEPKKSLHFLQTGKALIYLGRMIEALKYLEETTKQPDYEKFINNNENIDVEGTIRLLKL